MYTSIWVNVRTNNKKNIYGYVKLTAQLLFITRFKGRALYTGGQCLIHATKTLRAFSCKVRGSNIQEVMFWRSLFENCCVFFFNFWSQFNYLLFFNLSWHNGTLWRHKTWSTLTAPSRYPNQFGIIIKTVLWYSPRCNFTKKLMNLIHNLCSKITLLKLLKYLPGASKLTKDDALSLNCYSKLTCAEINCTIFPSNHRVTPRTKPLSVWVTTVVCGSIQWGIRKPPRIGKDVIMWWLWVPSLTDSATDCVVHGALVIASFALASALTHC